MSTAAPSTPAVGELDLDVIAVAAALDAVDFGVSLYDPEDRLIFWNDRFLELYPHIRDLISVGTRFEELIQHVAEIRVANGMEPSADGFLAERRALRRHASASIEQSQPGGKWYRIEEFSTAVGGWICIHTDITDLQVDRHNAERRTALLRGTLESIRQGLAAFDSNHRLTTWNRQYFEQLELPHAFAQVGTPLADIVKNLADRGNLGELDAEEHLRFILDGLARDRYVAFERTSASGRIFEVTLYSLDRGGFVAAFNDVTLERHAAHQLRVSEERYALAAAGSNDGLWDWDLRAGRIFYSPRWKAMLGHGEDEIDETPDAWFSRIHPDDAQRVKAQLDSHLRGGVSHFETEHRVRHADGTYRWMLTRGLAVRDQQGEAYRIAGSQTDITDRKHAEQQAIHDALHDNLTGLANRTLFLDRVRQSLTRSQRSPVPGFAVVYLDLDRFKLVNESLGHVHGDDLIIAAARRIEQSLRFGDTVARLGGDEFAILMEDIGSKSEAKNITEALQKALQSPFRLSGKDVFSTASMGIAHSSERYERPEDILRDAELAMYHAKQQGKAQSVVFQDTLRNSPVTPLDLDSDLRRAIERDEITLQYQPIIGLIDGRIRGFEALIRWRHARRGWISPMEFIPLAEETGIIFSLGQWVLRRACEQILAWNEAGLFDSPLEVSVNLSTRQFSRPDLVASIIDSLRGTGLEASRLKLEITESALMADAERSAEMLNQLKDLDIRVCVDDFGTGYSSLSYLHTFPIDTLKIDKSFIADMSRNHQNLEIVRTIAMLAQNLKLDVIAEGVETPEQLAQLRALGVDYAQGFLFSRPQDVAGVERLLADDHRW